MTQAVLEKYSSVADPPLPSLYLDEIPEDIAQLEGAYYEHQGEVPIAGAYHTGQVRPTMIDGRFTIHLFNTSATQVETNGGRVMQALVPTSLALTGGQTASLFRTGYWFSATKQRTKDNKPVYYVRISYLCKIGKPAA